ncbi:hypothetical protein NW754_007818 [Fusarium falciforme]|nr:hypothetical protein NW754_007818 [Fusarium falciforme]KAJ4181725.1 hypothetical protein NW767_014045 [Fusarium falciforme]
MSPTIREIAKHTKIIDIGITQVWGIVSAWGCESLWMPDCTSSALEGYGLGSIRVLTFSQFPGMIIRERLEAVDPGNYSLRFRVYRDDLKDMENYGNLKLEAVGPTQTSVQWMGESSLEDEEAFNAQRERVEDMYLGFTDSLYNLLK